ncbi:MAG: TrkA family potassium uptake protein [bacterium]|nr:TrkA family potassium uptake protein [bacterium]
MPPKSQLIILPKKRRHILRYFRAVWRDYSALFREFNRAIIIFLLFTGVGGFIYGELHALSYPTERLPLIARPYAMIQMMILETPPFTLPQEPHLIFFWYLMPVVLVYLVGRGASDFVRLFLNRDERRDAWRIALASTMKNHVVIFGAGHVGIRVVNELHRMGYDMVVIDNAPDLGIEERLQHLRVPLIRADGRLVSTLEKANIQDALAFVACTGNDHVNLDAVMRVRDMNRTIRIVSRAWDNEYAKQLKEFFNIESVLSSSDLSAPVFAGAALGIEITKTVTVAGVEYSLIRLQIEKGSFMEKRTVGDLQRTEDMDIVLHVRDDMTEVQPSHDMIVQKGDIIVIFARHERILSVVARNRGR